MKNVDQSIFKSNPAQHIVSFIENFVEISPQNRLSGIDDTPIFTAPLVGFADGEDSLFHQYRKEIIGSFHMTPREILTYSQTYTGSANSISLKNMSVICWAIPIAKRTKLSNAFRDSWPSLRWAHTRHYGELFNITLRRAVVSMLTEQGYLAVAPVLSPEWKEFPDYPGGPVSRWSERHALYAAGLGTFGLCDGLITEKGKAVRCGSVVVNLQLTPTFRPYKTHNEYCLFYNDKASCGYCIDRCPAGAITKKGHDKNQCVRYFGEFNKHILPRYGVEHAGCGLCQTKVPCESKKPVALDHKEL